MTDYEKPTWERFDSVRSINALIRVALAELRKEDEDEQERRSETTGS